MVKIILSVINSLSSVAVKLLSGPFSVKDFSLDAGVAISLVGNRLEECGTARSSVILLV